MSDRSLVIAVLFVAAVARMGALWQFGAGLRNDPDAYRVIADNLVAGRGYSLCQAPEPAVPTAYRPPLFPCLLASIRWSCFGNERGAALVLGALQFLMGVATVWLTIDVARRFDLSRAWIWAGLIVAADPLLLFSTTQVMTETTATFLIALTLWFAMRGPDWRNRLGTGLAFGLCCLCRPTFWAFGGLAGMIWLWSVWKRRSDITPESRQQLRSGATAFILGTIVVCAPWVVRNLIVMGRPILTTTHGGYTLLLGHNPFYAEAVANKPWGAVWESTNDARWIAWIETQLTGEQIPVERVSPEAELARDRWMTSQAWQYIRTSPAASIRCSLTLLGRMWNVAPLETRSRTLPAWMRWSIGGFYVVVFAALVDGLWSLTRREWLRWWPVFLLIATFSAVHALYWADMRMRAPLVPAIALLAARGVKSLRRMKYEV